MPQQGEQVEPVIDCHKHGSWLLHVHTYLVFVIEQATVIKPTPLGPLLLVLEIMRASPYTAFASLLRTEYNCKRIRNTFTYIHHTIADKLQLCAGNNAPHVFEN